jgi:uncharacterized protein YmfQ (DUF2313 family)
MATFGVEKYSSTIKKLFPTGWAFRFYSGLNLTKIIDSLSIEPDRVEQRAYKLLDELDPNTTYEMLDNWERLLRIPDECTPPGDPTIYERRVRILQKLTTGGGQSRAFFKLIAEQLGYDADIIDVVNFRDFRVGASRVGEKLSNSTTPGGGVGAAGWAYTFQIKAPAELTRPFRVGQGSVGQRLVLVENQTLECVIRKFAPAHVTVIFSYGG